jgi:hypothetical protein
MIMSTKTSTTNSMRHLFAMMEIARLKYNADARGASWPFPEWWVPPSPRQVQKDVMNSLADLGEQMGADPANWRTEPP